VFRVPSLWLTCCADKDEDEEVISCAQPLPEEQQGKDEEDDHADYGAGKSGNVAVHLPVEVGCLWGICHDEKFSRSLQGTIRWVVEAMVDNAIQGIL
jgi:hypothetical protein